MSRRGSSGSLEFFREKREEGGWFGKKGRVISDNWDVELIVVSGCSLATVENVELDFKPITRLRRNSIVVVFHEAASIRRAIGFQSGNSRWERGCPSTSTRHASLSNSSDFFDRTKILLPLPTIVLLAIKIPLHALLPSENSGIGIGGKSTRRGDVGERKDRCCMERIARRQLPRGFASQPSPPFHDRTRHGYVKARRRGRECE